MHVLYKSLILGMAASIQGIAMTFFLFPHFIPSGGAASLAVLFNYLLDTPYSVTLWILNAGLLLAAAKWLGKSSVIWTMFCVSVTSVTIDFLTPYITEPLNPVLLDLLLGAAVFGVGVGILFRMGASSGGMDILALIISKARGSAPGRTLFYINGSLLLLTGVVVDWKVIVYAVICQMIGTRMIDLIYKVDIKILAEKYKIHY
ncbi:putative 5xTM membrane YitT family protein [Cytobacillus firmus]|uniref:Putative 5xTM membrane YitT family protein n=2 Tax=Cytobacillus TaxID=2675230 RepID=A0A366JUN1_CYTFI|nr:MULTISPECIES: YitT family protein [Cytobacillus]RBP92917.1 putative 5xTM membrane YitT family protein [Cytobacillus firmus]TDX42519.1 putative 5xTM membrane YitT family protein [Cytobacillus oceanisediminis]